MKKIIKIIFTLVGIIFITAIIFLFILNGFLTGRIIEEYPNTYTQAICNKTLNGNVNCEDYEITCNKKKIIKVISTGFAVQHPENWKDPRGKNGSEIICR
jgi:hypothetical protein